MQCEIAGVLSSNSLGPISVHSLWLLYSWLVFLPKTCCIWLTVLRNGRQWQSLLPLFTGIPPKAKAHAVFNSHFCGDSCLRRKIQKRTHYVRSWRNLISSFYCLLLIYLFSISIKSMQRHHLLENYPRKLFPFSWFLSVRRETDVTRRTSSFSLLDNSYSLETTAEAQLFFAFCSFYSPSPFYGLLLHNVVNFNECSCIAWVM